MLAASKHELLKHTIIDRCPKHFVFCISRDCLIGILPDFHCSLERRKLVIIRASFHKHGSELVARSRCSKARQLKMVCLMDIVDYRRRKGPREPDAFSASRSPSAESNQYRRGKPEYKTGCINAHHLHSPSAALDRGKPEMATHRYCSGRPRTGERRPCRPTHASDGTLQPLHG